MKKKISIVAGAALLLAVAFFCYKSVIIKADDESAGGSAYASAVASTASPTMTPTATPVPTPTPDPRVYQKLRIGKKVRKVYEIDGFFKQKKHMVVFKKDDGTIVKKKFFLRKDRIYYATKTGEIQKGWKKLRNNIYFFSRRNGRLTHKPIVEGVKLNRFGIANRGQVNQERAATYVRAAYMVQKLTRDTDTREEKLYKCYKWVMAHPYFIHRKMRAMMKEKNWRNRWDYVFADDIFIWQSGDCVSYAAAFALMAKECGYKKVTLCCDTGHSWDDIGGYLYDPLFAKSRGFDANYHAHYHDYRINPAITKKIS